MISEVLIIGHVSEDYRNDKILRGGPPLYQLPIILASNINCHVITSAAADFNFPDHENLSLYHIPSTRSTCYKFEEIETHEEITHSDRRKLIIMSIANNLEYDNFSFVLKDSYQAIIIAPIADEISKNDMELICERSKLNLFDMQGLVRKFNASGEVYHSLDKIDFDWALRTFDVIKASKSELNNIIIENPYSSLLIVTNSGRDIEIYTEGRKEIISIEFIPESNIIDDTGSGDIFLAVLSITLNKLSVEESIRYADKIAKSQLVQEGIPETNKVKINI
jgi:hypothetical protein